MKWIEIEPVDWLIIGLRVDAVEGADEGDGSAVVVEATDRFRRRMPIPGNGLVPGDAQSILISIAASSPMRSPSGDAVEQRVRLWVGDLPLALNSRRWSPARNCVPTIHPSLRFAAGEN